MRKIAGIVAGALCRSCSTIVNYARRRRVAVDQTFFSNLQEKYEQREGGDEDWGAEKKKIQGLLEAITEDMRERMGPRYSLESPINIGGSGIVIRVMDSNLNAPQALKFPRPIAGKEPLLTRIISSEISRLIESSHPNIVAIFAKGEVKLYEQIWPYYIMEYIEGALDAADYVEYRKPNTSWIVELVGQCAEGLMFLHARDVIHGDVKLENLLVAPDGRVKISDLGSARLLSPQAKDETLLTFTSDYAHPDLRSLLAGNEITDRKRARAEVKRSQLKREYDLYALGKNLLRLLKDYDIADSAIMPFYVRRYLEFMACRMLDGQNTDSELALSLPKSAFTEIRYKKAEDVLLDIKKLTGQYSLNRSISELNRYFPRTIQISAPSPTSFTERVATLMSSPLMRRLAGLSQLGLIVQIFPTATHTRLEHVLGTLSNVVRYCDALWNDPINPLFKQIMDEDDINLLFSAAICHDIGHYPLAHDLEEAEGNFFSHKKIAIELLTQSKDEHCDSFRKILLSDWGVKPEKLSELLSLDPTDLKQPLKMRLLHTMIDGPMDADKMDYLIRDSINLNVPYGNAIDFERLLRCLTVVFKAQGANTFIALGIHEKGKIPAEAVAFARYAMFGCVYWHHTSRSAKAMLHRAVWELLPDDDKRKKEYRLFRDELLQEILSQCGVEADSGTQMDLLTQSSDNPLPRIAQLAVSDYRMLHWIHRKTSNQGKQLLQMLCERKLFKRLSVISERKYSNLWNKLIELRKEYGWQDVLGFQKKVQELLIEVIQKMTDEERNRRAITSKDVTDRIASRHSKGQILFLVDIPTERKGSSVDLYYLSERRIRGPLTSVEDSVQMEDSVIWNELSRNFLKSVGKIRVFCHPEIIEACTLCLKREDIEGALEASWRYVTKK